MADKNAKHSNDETARTKEREKTTRRAGDVRQRDLASDIQGRNKLQGNDQDAVVNQRRQQPKVGGATGRPADRSGPKEGND